MTSGPSPKIAILVPSQGTWKAQFGFWLCNLIEWTTGQLSIPAHVFHANDTVVQFCRTNLVEQALKTDATHFLWLDTDMTFPRTTVERLLAHKKPIVACNYATRRFPIRTVAHRGGSRLRSSNKRSGLEKVDFTGFGVVLIERKVFETMKQPWFAAQWMIDKNSDTYIPISEDVFFCRKAQESKFDILIDHDLSKEIGHIGDLEFTHDHVEESQPKLITPP